MYYLVGEHRIFGGKHYFEKTLESATARRDELKATGDWHMLHITKIVVESSVESVETLDASQPFS